MTDFFTKAAYAEAFGVEIGERFARFLEHERDDHDGHLAQLPTYGVALPVWFGGEALESFVNDDWPDFDEEGMPYGHVSAVEIDFDDFPGWVPLATLGEEESQVLLCKADEAVCPVAMWDHETGELAPVAATLDAFLASLSQE